MSSSIPRIFLGGLSFRAGDGGIARVARLMSRVLSGECRNRQIDVRGLSLYDLQRPADLGVNIRLANGSRPRYCLMAMQEGWRCSHAIFDACHLAQCHRLPCLRHRPMMTFMCGIEVWEGTKARYVNSIRRARLLLSISEYTRQRAERAHGKFSQARICWLGTEADALPSADKVAGTGSPEVLIVGRLESGRYKGHRELIACWPRVVAAVPEAILRIVGLGTDLNSLRELAAASPAAQRIVFQGFVPDEELERLYAEASVFAMPSRGEGFGLVYVEAMRHGLPVIASIHDAAPEIVLDGKTGYTVNLDLPKELPERIIHLLKRPEIARQFGDAGRQRWREHFRYGAFRDRFLPLLREFLAME